LWFAAFIFKQENIPMEKHEHKEISRDEIKKEFQLERMILFSDAVFAIVITLMAIEIHLPEGTITAEELPQKLFHLLPNLLAYSVSFFFIGVVWYQHLKMFSILKDYDKGLVIRNLILLFFIGLFPFSATVIARVKNAPQGFFIYMGIILICVAAQYFLYHYIIYQRPALRINANLEEHKEELRRRKISLVGFSSTTLLIILTFILIPDPEMKPLSTLWMAVFPIVYRLLIKKKK
jgi:uncharacterized membrane protein